MVGKIYLSKIYFTDLSGFKVRPVLIVKEYKDEDVLYLPLTTNMNLGGIAISDNDLKNGTLRKNSVAIIPKVSIIHKDFLIKEIGVLKHGVLQKIQYALCKSMGCATTL